VLPWWNKLSGFMVTPGIHAIHHGQKNDPIDKNFAGVFIFYDRLFGTYEPIIPSLKILFGVTKPPSQSTLWKIMIHEFRTCFILSNKPVRGNSR
jgi:sterol desaturase/sphingolipid hydroxylase (fatty acid hydroxylase superfamily)